MTDGGPQFITYQAYAEYYDFRTEAFAVDEEQIQLENEEKAWLYAVIDVDSKVVHGARHLKEKHLVA